MKTIALLTVWGFLLGSVFADEAAPQNWRSMKPDQLRKHVANLKTFSEVEKLLGKASRPSQIGQVSMYHYKVTDKLTLSITCDDENILDKKSQLRAVRSIYLFERDAKEHRVVWKIFTGPNDSDRKFRSDQVDIATKIKIRAEQIMDVNRP